MVPAAGKGDVGLGYTTVPGFSPGRQGSQAEKTGSPAQRVETPLEH